MKRIFTIVTGLMLTVSVFAQVPEKMSYQAVVRDASNNLVRTQAVGMQISILQSGTTGTAVYVETQIPTTNANGLVSLEIGNGAVVSGDFTTIDWSNNTYFIKTETDPTGGTNYTITGTSQLLSVPYALHSKTAENITGTVNYTETDPVFGVSIANSITAVDIANWNNQPAYYNIDCNPGVPSSPITIGSNGAMITFNMLNDCPNTTIQIPSAGTMYITSNGNTTLFNTVVIGGGGGMTSAANVITIQSACGIHTLTVNSGVGIVTFTLAGSGSSFTNMKLSVIAQ